MGGSFRDAVSFKGGGTSASDAFGLFLSEADSANQFSLCIGTPSNPGVLVLGGIGKKYYSGFQIVDIISNGYRLYSVGVNNISFGGDKESVSGSTFVDSGTSMLVLPDSVYDKLIDLSGNPSYSSDADCTISSKMAAKGVTLEAPGIASCHLHRCIVNKNWLVKGGIETIIGSVVMRNYFTHFDRSSRTIGFAQGIPECSPDQLPKLSRHVGSRQFSHGILNILENLM